MYWLPIYGTRHQALGNILLGLYAFQCAVGAIIHFFKPKNAKGRPPQNYLHAVFGLIVIVLGMYQIRTGYDEEWPLYAGSGRLPKSVNLLWIVWTIVRLKFSNDLGYLSNTS